MSDSQDLENIPELEKLRRSGVGIRSGGGIIHFINEQNETNKMLNDKIEQLQQMMNRMQGGGSMDGEDPLSD